ncbi:MAG: FemAB family protein [Microcoleus sp.]
MKIEFINLSSPLWLQTLEQLRHDFYHLPGYVALEATRMEATAEAISIADGEKIFFLPYLLRNCNTLFPNNLEVFDAVSPYGYPGFLLNAAAAKSPDFLNSAIEHLIEAWRDRNIYSAFLRLHPILNATISSLADRDFFTVNGETVSVDLTLDRDEIWRQTRSEHRTKINRCKREGFTTRMVPILEYIKDFNAVYEETMERVGASKSYLFGVDYLKKLADVLEEKFHLCIVELNGEITCAGLFAECSDIVQYHLGGTKTSYLKKSPNALMFDFVRFWAQERGNKFFHVGGGLGGSQDSLYHFKAGFSKQRHTFVTLRIITDKTKYIELVEQRAKSLNAEADKLLNTGFFPAYRSLG